MGYGIEEDEWKKEGITIPLSGFLGEVHNAIEAVP